MANQERVQVTVNKKTEMRTKDISKMISEGGLGAEKYYDITKNGLSPDRIADQTLANVMNNLIANHGLFYVKLHQYHWHVQGPSFFTLHEKFEELYNESTAYFDSFAERLIAKGERPLSTLSEYLDHALISEKVYEEKISAEQMVENLIDDYQTLKSLAIVALKLAEEENDAVTEDMLVEYVEKTDLTLWMLSAYIG